MDVQSIAILSIVFFAGIVITLGIVWIQHRSRMRAFEVLKIYAEKGEEPPASVFQAIGVGAPGIAPAPRRPTRADHLAHLAGSIVLSAGAAWLAWWRLSMTGEATPLVIFAVIVAIFFAGSAAARLVGAITTRDGD